MKEHCSEWTSNTKFSPITLLKWLHPPTPSTGCSLWICLSVCLACPSVPELVTEGSLYSGQRGEGHAIVLFSQRVTCTLSWIWSKSSSSLLTAFLLPHCPSQPASSHCPSSQRLISSGTLCGPPSPLLDQHKPLSLTRASLHYSLSLPETQGSQMQSPLGLGIRNLGMGFLTLNPVGSVPLAKALSLSVPQFP